MRHIYTKGYNIISEGIAKRIKKKYKRDGLISLFSLTFRISMKPIKYAYLKLFQNNKTFNFQGKKYSYFYSRISSTWENHRQVEIPIMMEIVNKNKDKKILEVGNVLSQFYKFPHTVVDKYEVEEGVINEDIIDFNPKIKYDLIVSISTFEHIGYDEPVEDSNKILIAIKKVKELLNDGGMILITLPLEENKEMDKLLKEERMLFDKQYYLKRLNKMEWKSSWIEVNKEEMFKNIKEKIPYNKLVIGVIRK